MGPRRKLTLAISELKEQEQDQEKKSASRRQGSDSEPVQKTSKPQLAKQCSTDVTEAYRQVWLSGSIDLSRKSSFDEKSLLSNCEV